MNHRAHLTSRRIEKPAGGLGFAADPGSFMYSTPCSPTLILRLDLEAISALLEGR